MVADQEASSEGIACSRSVNFARREGLDAMPAATFADPCAGVTVGDGEDRCAPCPLVNDRRDRAGRGRNVLFAEEHSLQRAENLRVLPGRTVNRYHVVARVNAPQPPLDGAADER